MHFLFLHDWPWILPWIKSISNELDIIIHVITSQLSGHCDFISNLSWHHQQNKKRASETQGWCVKIVALSSFMEPLAGVSNKIMYLLFRWTIPALTRVLFWCLFPSLLGNSGNKHQNNPLLSTETVCHSNTYIILFVCAILMTISLLLSQCDILWEPYQVTSPYMGWGRCQWLHRLHSRDQDFQHGRDLSCVITDRVLQQRGRWLYKLSLYIDAWLQWPIFCAWYFLMHFVEI